MQSTRQTAVDKCVMVCTTDLLINYMFKMKRRNPAPCSALYKFHLSDNKELRFIACDLLVPLVTMQNILLPVV